MCGGGGGEGGGEERCGGVCGGGWDDGVRGVARARIVVDGSISASIRASERGARGFDGDVGVVMLVLVFISYCVCIIMVL